MGLFSRWTGPGGNDPAATGFAGTVRSLLNLEVNTILADSMSAEPMPPLPHALLDIADWYAVFMCRLGADLDLFLKPGNRAVLETQRMEWSRPNGFSQGELKVGADTFDALRWAAKAALRDASRRSEPLTPPDQVMLYRIEKSCDALKGVMSSVTGRNGGNAPTMPTFWNKTRQEISGEPIDRNSYYVPPDEIVTLQRIWDLGTQTVVAQTVVFLNGNVTTRIQKGMDEARDRTLFDVHRQSVDVSIGCWHYLLQAIREIAGTALGVLTKPR